VLSSTRGCRAARRLASYSLLPLTGSEGTGRNENMGQGLPPVIHGKEQSGSVLRVEEGFSIGYTKFWERIRLGNTITSDEGFPQRRETPGVFGSGGAVGEGHRRSTPSTRSGMFAKGSRARKPVGGRPPPSRGGRGAQEDIRMRKRRKEIHRGRIGTDAAARGRLGQHPGTSRPAATDDALPREASVLLAGMLLAPTVGYCSGVHPYRRLGVVAVRSPT